MEFTYQNDYGVDYWLERANTIADMYEECFPEATAVDQSFTDFMNIFEAQDDAANKDSSETNAAKETMSTGFFASLKKAYDAMIKKLSEIIERVKKFFREKFASKEAKRQVAELQAKIDANPELKGIKVTIDDYDKINKIYADAEKKAQEALNAADKKDEDPESFNSTLNKIKEYVEKALPTAVKAIGLAGAAALAARFAGVVNETISAANEGLSKLEKSASELGKGSSNKGFRFWKRKSAYDKFLSTLRGEKVKKNSGGFVKLMKDIGGAMSGKKSSQMRLAQRAVASDSAGARAIRKTAGAAIGVAARRQERAEKKAAKAAAKNA